MQLQKSLRPLVGVIAFLLIGSASAQLDANRGRAIYTGEASADNDILFTVDHAEAYTACMLHSTAGAVDVEVRLGPTWTTAPLSLIDLGAVTNDPVLVTVAGRMYAIVGKYDGIRVRQNGATAATAYMSCYNTGSGLRE